MSARLTVLKHEYRAVQALSACPDIRIQLEAFARLNEIQATIDAESASSLPQAANFARRDEDPDGPPLSPGANAEG